MEHIGCILCICDAVCYLTTPPGAVKDRVSCHESKLLIASKYSSSSASAQRDDEMERQDSKHARHRHLFDNCFSNLFNVGVPLILEA